jgi:N-acetylglucosaminyldiphosphoundecaprenol N-acetyl-beta-D-mannosaminyltransferase
MKTQSQLGPEEGELRKGKHVLGTWIDALGWDEAVEQVVEWGAACSPRYICCCNVHSVVTATSDMEFMRALDHADLATCDGAPIAWALRWLGFRGQQRIAGPDLMWRYLRRAEKLGHRIYLYGSTDATLCRLRDWLAREFPGVVLAGMHAPPFGAGLDKNDEADVAAINASGANVVFVGLGCPKQEKWMAAHRGSVHAVMIGVGAAFNYHAGTLRRAPVWLQDHGLEWLFRLACEPRRLLRRYLVTNTLFVVGISLQFLQSKLASMSHRGNWRRHRVRECPPRPAITAARESVDEDPARS